MAQEFKYINAPSASYIKWEKSDVLTLNIPADKIANFIVIRNETANRYYAYPKQNIALFNELYKLSKKDALHEVIFGNVTQKLKFDIDAYIDEPDNSINPGEIGDSMITEIITAICDQFYDSYHLSCGDFIEPADIMITESCGYVYKGDKHAGDKNDKHAGDKYKTNENVIDKGCERRYKASYHIIVAPHKFAVANNEEAAGFVSQVMLRLSERAIKAIDYNVNKSIQNFRLLNSAKPGSNRVKKYKSGPTVEYINTTNSISDSVFIAASNNVLLTSLITYCKGLTILPRIYVDNKVKFTPITEKARVDDDMIDNILKMAADYTDGFEVRSVMNNMVVFDRVKPSYCKFCKETHHNDNTLVIFINKGDDKADKDDDKLIDINDTKYSISVMCRHNKDSVIHLGNIDTPTAEKESLDRILFDRANKIAITDNLATIKHKVVYNEPSLRDFARCRSLLVKAAMKMGKTKKLNNFLEIEYPQALNSRIVVLSFRRTFTEEFYSKYKDLGFVIYTDIEGIITDSRVIIQVESLHRLNITADPIDLLILDESESIIEQIDSGLFTNFTKSFAAFQWLIKTAGQVICMDALLGDRTYNVIKTLRGEDDLILHHNTFKNAIDDEYKMTTNFGKWLAVLNDSLENGERVAIDSNSLKDAEVIKELIMAKFPKLKIGMYSSKTYASVKKEHMSNVNHYWKQFDVLIKTPTISAGVSFEEEHFDRVFGFFIGITCTTQTCIQMLGRVRNVKSKQYCIYVKPNGSLNLPVKRDIILLLLKMRHRMIMDNIDISQLSFSYRDDGGIDIYNSDYIALWLENIINKNLNRNNFYGMLMHYIKSAGAKVSLLECTADQDCVGLEVKCRDLKQAIKAEELDNIAKAEDIDTTKANELFERKRNQSDINEQEHYQLEKYIIREHYGIAMNDTPKMTPDFIEIYKDRTIKSAFRNTKVFKDVITGKREYDEVLNECRDNDVIYKNAIPLRFELRTDSMRMDKNNKNAIQQTKTSVIDAFDINHKYMYDKMRCLTWLLNCCGWKGPFDKTRLDEGVIIDNIMANREELNKLESINMIISLYDINWRMIPNDRAKVIRAVKYYINRILRELFDISFVKIAKTKYDILMYYQLKQSDNFTVDDDGIRANFTR